MAYRRMAVFLVFVLMLTGCGDNIEQAEAPRAVEVANAVDGASAEPSVPTEGAVESLRQIHAGQPLAVADVSELEIDGASVLVIAFTVPLDPDQSLDAVFSISDRERGRLEGGWELSDDLKEVRRRHLEPRRNLSVTIEANVRSVAGVTLGAAQTHSLVTRDQPATVGFASRGSLLPSRLADGLPVVALNVDKIDVEFFRIRPERLHGFLSEWNRQAAMDMWQLTELPGKADVVYTAQFALDPPPNTRERIALPLDGIAPLEAPGVYLAVMRPSGSYRYSMPVTVFTRSDLGLSLRRTAASFDAFVQSLEDGRVLSAVTVSLLDDKGLALAQGTTDEDGHVRLPGHRDGRLVLATRDNESSLIRLQEAALDLAEFVVSGPPSSGLTLFAFGPRDLYRPGETVPVNAILRDVDGRPAPALPISVSVLRPDGETVREFVWQADAGGLYQYHYPLAQDAPTGRWQLRMDVGAAAPVSYTFLVEDFLPERLALDLEAAGAAPLEPADDAHFRVRGRYLYGAPASGNALIGQLFVAPLREAVATLPGFEFGDITDTRLTLSRDLDERWLDDDGVAEWAVPSEWSDAKSPVELVLQASVQESGGRPVTRRLALPVWPAERLVGIRPLFADGRSDASADARFEVAVADRAGKRPGATGLEVRLVHERRDYFWQFSQVDGWTSEYSQKDLVLSAARHDVSPDDRLELALPVDWGWYRIEVVDPDTGLLSSVRFFAGHNWQESTEAGSIRPDQVRLALDRPRYRAGDIATITVEPPAAGDGYLIVESADGPLWWEAISVPAEGADFELPIADEWARHDLYISALVVRPGSRASHTVPRRAVGLIHLPLDREDRRIDLVVEAAERVRPGRPLPITVSVPDRAGESIRVIVSAVDVGILNLTRFETPDPFAAFFGRRAYGVDMLDVYGQLIELGQARRAGLNFGGDQDSDRGGRAPISSVTLVALQSEPVTLDASGRAEIHLDIPDFNGELRIMAQAWTDSDYGMSEGKTVVVAPLVVEMAAPRFIAGHDRSQIALDVTNLTDTVQTLTPEVVIGGLLAHADATAQGSGGNAARAVSVAEGGDAVADAKVRMTQGGEVPDGRRVLAPLTLQVGERQTLRFAVAGLPGTGQGEVQVVLTGLDLLDDPQDRVERSWLIGVRPAWPAVTSVFAAALPGGADWSLREHAPLYGRLDAARVSISLSSRPPLDLAEHVRELFAYPYGCAEQTVSGLYPSLYARPELLAALGIRGDPADVRRARIDTGIERLLGMQRFNGSFGLWGRDGVEEYWVSVYVTDFLLRAAEEGFAVPETALVAARNRLIAYLQNPRQIESGYTQAPEQTRFAVQAYAAYVLARNGQAPLGALRQLHQRRADAPSGLALAQLGFALKRMGDGARSDALLGEASERVRAGRAWIGDYGSDVRDHALMLALFEEHDLMPRVRESQYLALGDALRQQQWFSTQERNALFLAGRHAFASSGKPWQARVVSLGEHLFDDDRPRSITLGEDALGDDVRIANTADATLYHRSTLSGYPRAPLAADDGQISVERHLLRLDGSAVDESLVSGELVIVHLSLRSEARVHDALVIDLLPAGLELENQRLDQSARLPAAGPTVTALLQRRGEVSVEHEAFLGDRYVAAIDLPARTRVDLIYLARAVTPGTYRVPPPLVESMYNPAVQGRGVTPHDLIVTPR